MHAPVLAMRAEPADLVSASAPEWADLAVTRLVLTEFRNYERLTLEVMPKSVVLTGPNGAGKTNLLEAISLLAPGRGLRRAKLADLARNQPAGSGATGSSASEGGSTKWAVAAHLNRGAEMVQVGTGVEAPQTGGVLSDAILAERPTERRLVRIDGQSARGPAALGDVVAVRWLTPQMDRLFADGASGRRRFLDHLTGGYDSNHSARISAYERTMRHRSLLLREGRGDPAWFSALEETMAELGVAIAAARRDVVARISTAMAGGDEVYPGARLTVDGDVEGWLDGQPALAAETKFREALERSRMRDGVTGGATSGPHRSDLAVWHTATEMPAAQCSTGEQKAILIAIVLADVRLLTASTGHAPLVLMDEVAAHLDEDRRNTLYDLILGFGAQIWATGTDRKMFGGLEDRAQFLNVADGQIGGHTGGQIGGQPE